MYGGRREGGEEDEGEKSPGHASIISWTYVYSSNLVVTRRDTSERGVPIYFEIWVMHETRIRRPTPDN